MRINGEITFTYKSKSDAKLAYESLEVDNEDYLESDLKGNMIIYEVAGERLGTFLATVDDLIASEIVVEKIVGKIKQ